MLGDLSIYILNKCGRVIPLASNGGFMRLPSYTAAFGLTSVIGIAGLNLLLNPVIDDFYKSNAPWVAHFELPLRWQKPTLQNVGRGPLVLGIVSWRFHFLKF
jgi:hypothetical protein